MIDLAVVSNFIPRMACKRYEIGKQLYQTEFTKYLFLIQILNQKFVANRFLLLPFCQDACLTTEHYWRVWKVAELILLKLQRIYCKLLWIRQKERNNKCAKHVSIIRERPKANCSSCYLFSACCCRPHCCCCCVYRRCFLVARCCRLLRPPHR